LNNRKKEELKQLKAWQTKRNIGEEELASITEELKGLWETAAGIEKLANEINGTTSNIRQLCKDLCEIKSSVFNVAENDKYEETTTLIEQLANEIEGSTFCTCELCGKLRKIEHNIFTANKKLSACINRKMNKETNRKTNRAE
jgi:hypothetical protein